MDDGGWPGIYKGAIFYHVMSLRMEWMASDIYQSLYKGASMYYQSHMPCMIYTAYSSLLQSIYSMSLGLMLYIGPSLYILSTRGPFYPPSPTIHRGTRWGEGGGPTILLVQCHHECLYSLVYINVMSRVYTAILYTGRSNIQTTFLLYNVLLVNGGNYVLLVSFVMLRQH